MARRKGNYANIIDYTDGKFLRKTNVKMFEAE
jgi:hypothetical protein